MKGSGKLPSQLHISHECHSLLGDDYDLNYPSFTLPIPASMNIAIHKDLVMVTLVWCLKFTVRTSVARRCLLAGLLSGPTDLRETRECAAHTSHRRHTHMLMHASYDDANAISARRATETPIWITGVCLTFHGCFAPSLFSLAQV